MTEQDKENLMKLLWRFYEEELNCNGDCHKCYYYMNPTNIYVDDCPLLITYDMIYRKTHGIEKWK